MHTKNGRKERIARLFFRNFHNLMPCNKYGRLRMRDKARKMLHPYQPLEFADYEDAENKLQWMDFAIKTGRKC